MISTKTFIPKQRDYLLRRPRLVNCLHRYIDLTLTLVSAPAGYGKTSLLADFSHDAPFPVCWLSLDESDQDLHTFVEYLVAALRRRFPDFGAPTLRALAANLDAGNKSIALAGVIVQDVVDHAPEFFALVLDDYHTVDNSPEVNRLIGALFNHRPDHWHLIIASRTVPPNLPIVLLTAREQIAFIGQADLAFTAKEVQTLMAQMHGIDLTPEQAEELVAESEGWITGILLSKSVMWRGMRDMLARAKSQEGPVYTYLAEQVFKEQPPALQDYMLISSTLHEMNDTLCREALGLTDAAQTLQEMERRGVFVTALTDETDGTWYRYHHLFREFLQKRLRSQDDARFCQLHRQAADWFEANEQWESAVTHRLTAGDPYATARTMERGVTALFYAGRMETLVAWYKAVPESLHDEFPRLMLFAARALVNLGRLDEALPLLSRAEERFEEQDQLEQALLAALQRAEIWYAWGHYIDLLSLAQAVLARSADYAAPTAEAHRLTGLAYLNLGQPEEAIKHLQTALELYRKLGRKSETGLAYVDLSLACVRLGRLSVGWTYQDKAIEILRQQGPSGQFAMALNNAACEHYYLSGDYAPALTFLAEALEVSQAAGYPRGQAFALLTTADLYRDLGALEQAQTLYVQAEQIARRLEDGALTNFALNGIAQARLMADDSIEALSLAAQARDQARQRQDVYQLGLSHLTLGAAHLRVGTAEAALAEVERGRDLLVQSSARRDLTRAYMLLARARQAVGDLDGALEALEQALDVGIETQSFHYLVVEGQKSYDLFKELQERDPADRRPAEIMRRIRALPDVAREVVGGLAPAALPHRPTLRFCALGPGTIERDGEPIPASVWRSALARYLTFYLLLHAPCNRDQITDVFWPEVPREKAGSTFHWVKHQIQHALGRKMVVHEEGLYRVRWEPDCWFDVSAFESLLDGQDGRQTRLEEAVALYQGDFLEGYDANWCRSRREGLRARFRDALIELGEIYKAQGAYDRAFVVLSRAVAMDDLYEPAGRALMQLYAQDGRRRAALKHFRGLKGRLQQELGTAPTPETQALFRAIKDDVDLTA